MRATKAQFEEFKRSLIWLDIKEFLGGTKDDIIRELGDVNPLPQSEDFKLICINRGRLAEINMLLELPDMLVEEFKMLEENKISNGKEEENG